MGDVGQLTVQVDTDDLLARLRTAPDFTRAVEMIMDHLVGAGMPLPSLYLRRGGRMRCIAYRNYWQVLDGIPSHAGVIGETLRTGRTQVVNDTASSPSFLEAISGTVAEICVPLRYGGGVLGILNVESTVALGESDVAEVERCAAALMLRMGELGGPTPESPWQLLARHVSHLAGLSDIAMIQRYALHAACELAGMDSAGLLLPQYDDLSFAAVTGPLSRVLERSPTASLDELVQWASGGISCWTHGEESGSGFRWNEPLRAAGVRSLVSLPLATGWGPAGALLIADAAAVRLAPESLERLELLANQVSTSLRVAAAMTELRQRASQDGLTGLRHHAAFHGAVSQRRTRPGRPAAVLLIDIDGFKQINDTQGHPAGDRLLVELSAVLLAALPDDAELFRVGGDEFAVLAEAGDPDTLGALARRLVDAVRAAGRVTVSIGGALDGRSHDAGPSLIERADLALYRAKAAGRDGWDVAHRTG